MLHDFWSAPRSVFGCGILIFENAFGRTWAISCTRSYRTLRDGSFEGTLFQALRARLRSVSSGRACGHFATASS